VTDIPFAAYDVIFYMGANRAQYGTGTGIIVFNGGPERAFTVENQAFDGTFTEMVDASTPGNYIVYEGVTGSSFTTQTWGTGPTGFNHIGPFGFQIREATATATPYADWAALNSVTEGPDGDDDNGGTSNIAEFYYFDSNPQVAEGNGSPVTGATKTGADKFEFIHNRRINRGDVTETYLWSSDLNTWYASGSPDGGGITVTVADKSVVAGPTANLETVTAEATVIGGTLDELFVRQLLTTP